MRNKQLQQPYAIAMVGLGVEEWGRSDVLALYSHVRKIGGREVLEDDFFLDPQGIFCVE